jgi:hypothetical protein
MADGISEFDLGYIMGIVVSEGSFTGDWRNPCLQIKLHQRDVAVLEFLQRTLGGKIYGPYHHGDRHYSMWLLRGRELDRAVALFVHHLPASHRRTQFLAWIAKYAPWKEQYAAHLKSDAASESLS